MNFNLIIPAKALLFGEYSLLNGGRALACILPNLFFEVQTVIEQSKDSIVIVESDFFESGKIEFSLGSQDDNFFHHVLSPWIEHLNHHKIVIKILESFSPSLGFGSSSALIAAISCALFEFVQGTKPNIHNTFLWEKVRASLQNVQTVASGYDVGVQLAYLLSADKHKFWTYQNNKNQIVPNIKHMHIDPQFASKLGCFVKTNIYSDTKKALKVFQTHDPKTKDFFSQEHKRIAENFLQSLDLATLEICMHESVTLAKKQGILIEDGLSDLLKTHHISFKTMGSGLGDCLWVLETQKNLLKFELKPSDVVFSFEDFVS